MAKPIKYCKVKKNKKNKGNKKNFKNLKKKKVGHERLHNVWFHSCEIFRIGKSIGTEQISSCQRLRGAENGEWELMSMEFLLRGDENVLELVLMMVVQLSEYIENHWIVCFKRMCFMVCGLYLHWNEKQLPGLGFYTLGPIPSTCCISGFFLGSSQFAEWWPDNAGGSGAFGIVLFLEAVGSRLT